VRQSLADKLAFVALCVCDARSVTLCQQPGKAEGERTPAADMLALSVRRVIRPVGPRVGLRRRR